MSKIKATILTFGLPDTFNKDLAELSKQVTAVDLQILQKGTQLGNAILKQLMARQSNLIYVFVDNSLKSKLSGALLESNKIVFVGAFLDITNAMSKYLPTEESVESEMMSLPTLESSESSVGSDTYVANEGNFLIPVAPSVPEPEVTVNLDAKDLQISQAAKGVDIPNDLPTAQKYIIDIRADVRELVRDREERVAKVMQVKGIVESMTKTNKELESRSADLEARLGNCNSKLINLQSSYDKVSSEAQSSKAQLTQMSKTINDSTEKLLALSSVEKRMQELERELELEKNENSRLISELEQTSDRIEDLTLQISESNAQSDDQTELHKQRENELLQKVSDLETEIDELQKQIDERNTELVSTVDTTEIEAKVKEIEHSLELKERELTRFKDLYKEANAKVKEVQAELQNELESKQNVATITKVVEVSSGDSVPEVIGKLDRVPLSLANVTFVARVDNLDLNGYLKFLKRDLGASYYVVDLDYSSKLYTLLPSSSLSSLKNINRWLSGKYTYKDLHTPLELPNVDWKGLLTTFLQLPFVKEVEHTDLPTLFSDVILSKERVLVNLGCLSDATTRKLIERYDIKQNILVYVGQDAFSSKVATQVFTDYEDNGLTLHKRVVGVEGVRYIRGFKVDKTIERLV